MCLIKVLQACFMDSRTTYDSRINVSERTLHIVVLQRNSAVLNEVHLSEVFPEPKALCNYSRCDTDTITNQKKLREQVQAQAVVVEDAAA